MHGNAARDPSHPLTLHDSEEISDSINCTVCEGEVEGLIYGCSHGDCDGLWIHLGCADDVGNDKDEEEPLMKHPSHPQHELRFSKKTRWCPFPFVKQQRAQILDDHDNYIIGGKYNFSNHPHLLTYTAYSSSSSSSYHHHCKKEDDEDEFDSIPGSEIICDGCTLVVHQKKQIADDDEYENDYMSCDECKYFLHLSCFNLPLHIPSLPFHPLEYHNLKLQNVVKLTDWICCSICNSYMSGLYYKCTNKDCWFNIDIKCASLPNTIKHTAHPRHNNLKLVTDDIQSGFCVNCYDFMYTKNGNYRCSSCRISVCGECVMLPATNKHRLENHLLWLTYDARGNRPGKFYCSSCEDQMDPRSWMYHCRDCDQSFHPRCFPAMSGKYRNFKFGTKHVISSIHDHPLRFQIITNKKRCDLCHRDAYDNPGFQCASCFFAVCIECGMKHLGDA